MRKFSAMRNGVHRRVCAGLVVLVGLCWPVAGCKPSQPTTPPGPAETNGETAAESSADSPSGGQRGLKVRPNATSFTGRWGLLVTQAMPDQSQQPAFRELCLSLLEFQPADGAKFTGSVIATMPQVPETSLADLLVDGNDIQFVYHWGEQQGDFQGTLVDGVVRGSLRMPGFGVIPAMLRPTDETSYEGWDPVPLAPGRAAFTDATKSKDQPAAMLAAAREMRGSPLSLEAYDGVLQRLGQYADLKEAQVRQMYTDSLDAARLWGPRILDQAKFKAAMGVTMTRRFPELALEFLEQAEQVNADFKAEIAETLEIARDQVQVDLALRDLKSTTPETPEAAYQKLQELLEKQRYNAEILGALGAYAAQHEQPDQAIEYLADVIALPLLEAFLLSTKSGQPPGDPSAREQLLTLWETKHGSVEGFEEFLDATYQRRLAEMSDQIRQAGPAPVDSGERKRTTLVELFTGTGCPPCVAADLAAESLQHVYPTSDMVVLQYHQHIPAPDPLTNQDAEDRFAYYEGGGTPTLFIDGYSLPPQVQIGGYLQRVGTVYETLRPLVDLRLKMPSVGELTLAAEVREGDLMVSAKGENFPEDVQGNLRLRLALVENHIALTVPNGLRHHHYVVREMLGGAKGTSPRDGKLECSLQMPAQEVEQHLQDYLKQFEAGRNVEFPIKPTTLGELSLVGWVQNDATREILVTKLIPVTGTAAAAPMPPTSAGDDQPNPPASATDPANTKAADSDK